MKKIMPESFKTLIVLQTWKLTELEWFENVKIIKVNFGLHLGLYVYLLIHAIFSKFRISYQVEAIFESRFTII